MTHQNLLFRLKALGLISISALASAQYDDRVGINTDTPKATLDLRPNPDNALATATTNEGLLIPKLSKARVANITTPENATMIYVENLIYTGTDPRVSGIISPGFYYYDNSKSKWIKLNDLVGSPIEPTGLERLTENGNTGWRLIGRDPNFYGNIGFGAIDFSHSTFPSTVNGATGPYSVALGPNAIASSSQSFAVSTFSNGSISSGLGSIAFNGKAEGIGAIAIGGPFTLVAKNRSLAIGKSAEAKENYSEAIGHKSKAEGENSHALFGGIAKGKNSMAIGTDYNDVPSTAEGIYSYALFGGNTTSTAPGGIAIGYHSKAEGQSSYSLFGGRAKGQGSMVIGGGTAEGSYSKVLFDGTTPPDAVNAIVIGRGTAYGDATSSLFGGHAKGQGSVAIGRATSEGSSSYAVFNAYTASTATGSIAIGAVVTEPHIIAIGGAPIYAGIGPSYSKVAIGNLLYLEKDLKMKANALGDCNANTRGTIKFDGTNFHGCTPSGWKQLNN